ncbi:MAG: polysaccharide deacetylase family protein [Clostridia bacterium]|nr:polysaccharide deacetylase family protein [Clostridia bacterium]
MKIFSLTKKEILTSMGAFLIAATALSIGGVTVNKAVSAASEPRDIPIYSVETDEKKVAISFDAAWGNEQTPELLDILDRYDVKATFFLVGQWVDNFPESVKEIAAQGHDVENHSNTHAHMPELSLEGMSEEIVSCNDKIKALTGKCPTLFRPPYGDYNNDVVASVKNQNMYCIQWDVDSLDWKDLSAEEITQRVTSKLQNGSIVLLHNGAKNTPEALPSIIEGIKAQGYELVPISELVPEGEYQTDHEGRMHISADNP